MARREDAAKLRGLAGELGYDLVKAPIRGCWFLVDERGVHAVADDCQRQPKLTRSM